MVNKFARTFTGQMDTLHRCRSGPEQKVTVNNVSVNEGGQAIVGSVTHKRCRQRQPDATNSPPLSPISPA